MSMIKINEEFVNIKGGYSKDWSMISSNEYLWKKRWIDNVLEMMQARGLTVNVNTRRSSNKIVMDYILEYTSNIGISRP